MSVIDQVVMVLEDFVGIALHDATWRTLGTGVEQQMIGCTCDSKVGADADFFMCGNRKRSWVSYHNTLCSVRHTCLHIQQC